jgi:hypothetical protein
MNRLFESMIEYNVYQIQQDTPERDQYNFFCQYINLLVPFLKDEIHMLTRERGIRILQTH